MFVIQYETIAGTHSMQNFDSTSRTKLAQHLARFGRPILAVFEQATPITKAMRGELARMPQETISKHAREFAASR